MLPTAEEIEKAKADLAQQLSAQIHARQAKQIEAPAAKVPAGTASARLAENIAEASAAGATPYIQVERKLPNGKRRYEAWTPEGKLLMSSPRITANAQSLARRKGRYENVLNFMPELEEADDFQEQLGKQLSEADAREAELTAKRQRLESQSAARTGPGPRGESADSESANNDRSTIGAGPGPHGHYEEEDAKQADDPAVKTLLDERQRILDEAWQTVNATGYDDFPNKNRRHEAQEALKRIDADLAHRGRQPSIYPSLSEHLEARVMQRDLRRTAEQKRGTEYDPATGEFSAPRADAAAAATPPEGAASLSQITAAMAKRRKRPTAAEFKRLKAALQEERAKGEGQQDQGPQKRRQEASDEVLREAQHQLDLETVKPQGVPPGKAYDAQDEARGAAIKAKLIQDFGEKIGGARKDTARPIGARKDPGKPKDDRPGWARRYDVHQIAKSSNPFEEGKWAVYDSKQKNFLGQAKRVGVFESREEAEKAVPRAEAARAHGVSAVQRPDGGTEFYIYRKVNDRKHPVVKSGFASMEEARRYLAEHPREIVEHKFPSYEEYQYLDHVERQGGQSRQGDVSTKQFHSTFGFRGGEFGKWQENRDGQTSLNHAYDALHDLADVLGLPPKALALDNTLSIGFGSRGTGGKLAPRAHYEPDKRVINLTKMKGAGTLAHEWVHGMRSGRAY
jgi:hypothetical protein